MHIPIANIIKLLRKKNLDTRGRTGSRQEKERERKKRRDKMSANLGGSWNEEEYIELLAHCFSLFFALKVMDLSLDQ